MYYIKHKENVHFKFIIQGNQYERNDLPCAYNPNIWEVEKQKGSGIQRQTQLRGEF